MQHLLFSPTSSLRQHDSAVAEPPTWETKIGASATSLRKETFVIGDDELEITLAERPMSVFEQQRVHESSHSREWTMSYELLVALISDARAVEKETFEKMADNVASLLPANTMTGMLPFRTMMDQDHREVTIEDIEESSLRLEGLVATESDKPAPDDEMADDTEIPRLILRRLNVLAGLEGTDREEVATIASIYSGMARTWLTSLPPRTPETSRLAKAQLVRSAAAQVALAALVVRAEQSEEPPAPEVRSSEPWELPLRSGPAASGVPATVFHDARSQPQSQASVLPTPLTSATPSLNTTSGHAFTFAAPEVSRLSKYTSFSKPAPSALPRSLNNVLSHWTVGTSLADYDWLSTSRRLSQRDEEYDEEMTEKERARLQRRAERHIRRQRKEAAASQAAQLASSQAPEIISASQPQHISNAESQPQGAAGSSQNYGFGMPSTSQVVPGRFGGRPPARKKRKQGF